MYRYREPAICRHIKLFGEPRAAFCNHYSYKLDFVNYLRELGFLPHGTGKKHPGKKQKAPDFVNFFGLRERTTSPPSPGFRAHADQYFLPL
jgi:hypothetical protein